MSNKREDCEDHRDDHDPCSGTVDIDLISHGFPLVPLVAVDLSFNKRVQIGEWVTNFALIFKNEGRLQINAGYRIHDKDADLKQLWRTLTSMSAISTKADMAACPTDVRFQV